MSDDKLIGLLGRAIDIQKTQWLVMSLIESYITNNHGLTMAQTNAAYDAIETLASSESEKVTQQEVDYFMEHVAKVGTIIRTTNTVTPMEFEEFAQKYKAAREANGDPVGDLTIAYGVYCNNPANHFLHKE